MSRGRFVELEGLIGKYATRARGLLPSSVEFDFKKAVGNFSPGVLKGSLVKAILASDTPSLKDIFKLLYEHSSRQVRAQFLNAILEVAPDLRGLLPDPTAVTIYPKHTDRISATTISKVADYIDTYEPAVDAVSRCYARHLPAIYRLPLSVQGVMLSDLAGRLAAPEAMPDTSAKAVLEPQPEPRYACVQAFRETSPNVRGPELGKDQPFKMGQTYQFELSVRTKVVSIAAPKGPRRFREPRQSEPVDIIITAESDDFEVLQPVS